ncbi:hypothetical protein [Seleniivibrio woodruffii]|uniref:hypothetical protein n=1 Tax=Seleniivibrio woodruffii TaxID=1078050 RepID=UPI0026F03501|nr:hypothetical protein [Seleniivibrio woodruffii]
MSTPANNQKKFKIPSGLFKNAEMSAIDFETGLLNRLKQVNGNMVSIEKKSAYQTNYVFKVPGNKYAIIAVYKKGIRNITVTYNIWYSTYFVSYKMAESVIKGKDITKTFSPEHSVKPDRVSE